MTRFHAVAVMLGTRLIMAIIIALYCPHSKQKYARKIAELQVWN